MRTTTWQATVMAGMIVTAGASAIGADRQVLVCMDSKGLVPASAQYRATAQASAIFAKIGVGLTWARRSDCVDGGVEIQVVPKAPETASPSALAHALPFGNRSQRITIFYDRVQRLVGPQENWIPAVLGHVLAHEIGHVLLGTDGHTDTGLMEAQWTKKEVSMMQFRPLGFTPAHVDLIHERLDHGTLSATLR